MDDYINRQAALQILAEFYGFSIESMEAAKRDGCYVPHEYTKMENIPPADVRPVVRGRWIWSGKERDRPYCSECLNDAFWDNDYGFVTENYCPICGADMREVET